MNYRVIDFMISGLLHMAVLLCVLLPGPASVQSAREERPLAVSLDMFELQPVPEVVQPVPEPEPLVSLPKPLPVSPAPVQQEVHQRPEPLPVGQPKPRQVAKPRPAQPPPPAERPRLVESADRRDEPAPPLAPVAAAEPPPTELRDEPRPDATAARIRESYLSALVRQINRKKYYPRSARRQGEEGRVLVSFVIRKDGQLADLIVLQSSGSRRLDEAALKTLRRVTPFHPIPDVLDRDQWPITVPIAFSLRG